jgi:G3E family GTPase
MSDPAHVAPGGTEPGGAEGAPPLPLVVLTGFLGSGKTTLLSRLLARAELGDAAVLINELGEVAIDHHLVADVRGDLMVLDSGCVCCTVREDLAEAIAGLLEQRERGSIPPFARIVLETTGAADPEPIIHTVALSPLLAGRVMVDAVITTLDLQHAEATLDHPEARSQVALADRIVLTKADLATGREIARAEQLLDLLAQTASRATATHGEVDPAWALAPGMATIARRCERGSAWLDASYGPVEHGAEPCDHDPHDHHAHGAHHGASGLSTRRRSSPRGRGERAPRASSC